MERDDERWRKMQRDGERLREMSLWGDGYFYILMLSKKTWIVKKDLS